MFSLTPTLASAPFNADFYTVAAAVIPVYFLILLFPGGILARYAIWTKKLRSRYAVPIVEGEKPATLRLTSILHAYDVLYLPVTAAMVFGVWGEVSAVRALDHEHATSGQHWWVLTSMVGFPIFAGVSAAFAVSFAWAETLSKEGTTKERQTEPDGDPTDDQA
jgi:hypothetical protein